MIHLHRSPVGPLATIACAVTLMGVASLRWAPIKIIYNSSSSVPQGWYAVESTAGLHRGDFALVRLPASVAQLADQRRYLPRSVPLLKRVGAVAGDQVCERGGLVHINGVLVAQSLDRDGAGRPLVPWSGCRPLIADELFLLGTTSAASFDSRYYGPVSFHSVMGVALPWWTW
jgi:conjugative transfer signal peptidase TraF